METLNEKLKKINTEYKEFNQYRQKEEIKPNTNYKKMLEDTIKESEQKSKKLNSFLTDSSIYNQPNQYYKTEKDENIGFSNDNDIEKLNNQNNEKMSSLLFTNYKNEMKSENVIFNSQKGNLDGNMILPINTQESYTKNRKHKNSMITNSRMNNYQPIGKSMNMMYDNKLETSKSKVYKDVANNRLNELNKMASINPYPIKYENRVSAMTKDYFNYDTQTEKELNKYYKKNKNK